jgi:hypothetical protein
MQTSIPSAIFGGDMLALLSDRLQQALLADVPDKIMSSSAATSFVSELTSHVAGRSQDVLWPLPGGSTKRTTMPQAFDRPDARKDQEWPTEVLPNPAYTRVDPLARGISSKYDWERPSEISLKSGQEWIGSNSPSVVGTTDPRAATGSQVKSQQTEFARVSESTGIAERSEYSPSLNQHRQRRSYRTSLLVRLLNRYWDMRHDATTSTKPADVVSPNQTGAPRHTGYVSPSGPFRTSLSAQWPDVTANQAARRIEELGSRNVSGPPHQVRQDVQAGQSDRVEIQNVFNVQASSDGAHQLDSTTDLAETIADILREQALQHGIDIT